MSFFSKMQNALANWMQGRNGPDNLGFTALVAAIVFSLLSLFRLPLASFLSMLCYVYALWRMLSRNVAKRQEEIASSWTNRARAEGNPAVFPAAQGHKDLQVFPLPAVQNAPAPQARLR